MGKSLNPLFLRLAQDWELEAFAIFFNCFIQPGSKTPQVLRGAACKNIP